jgi:hypothetical protein
MEISKNKRLPYELGSYVYPYLKGISRIYQVMDWVPCHAKCLDCPTHGEAIVLRCVALDEVRSGSYCPHAEYKKSRYIIWRIITPTEMEKLSGTHRRKMDGAV